MSFVDPLDPTLAAWLDSGPTALPDATRRAIAAGVSGTGQRRARPSVRVGRGAPSRFQALGIAVALVAATILGVLAVTGGPDPSPREGPTTSSPTPVDRVTTGSVTFTSTLYGYTLRHPAEWTAEPATERWTGGAWAELDAGTDVLFAGSVRPRVSSDRPWLSPWFTAKALSVPLDTTATSWADSNVPRRIEQTLEGGTVCRYGSTYVPMGWPPEWKDATVGGEPGRIRAACGFVDAVVVVDGQAFVFSMYTHRGADKTEPFEAIARTIAFATGDDPAQSFTSDLYGYQVTYPAGWALQPATEAWSGTDWAKNGASADVLLEPRYAGYRQGWFAVKATGVSPGTIALAWAEANVPLRPEFQEVGERGHRHCRMRGDVFIEMRWSDEWLEQSIGGQPARVRSGCGYVDAVVIVGGRAYILSSFQWPDSPSPSGIAHPFDLIAKTIVFGPDDADTTPFVSSVYGYAARYPTGWTVVRATRPWVPGELPSRTPLSDRFEDPAVARSSIVVASAKVPDGLPESAWRALRLPSRQRCGLGGLLGRVGTWEPITIDGREGHVRSGCGSIDAVVVAERRAYAISVSGPYHYEGATAATQVIFDAFVATIKLRPGDAVMPDQPR